MALAIFDLDETLISTDSDYEWGRFVVARGLVDRARYEQKNEEFYRDYKRGHLDIDSYLRFTCAVLAETQMAELLAQRRAFVEQVITPTVLPKARALVASHERAGDQLIVITSTNQFITEPIVEKFGITNLIAPVPETKCGKYTGNIVGTPSFGAGKVTRLNEWLARRQISLEGSYFYSDSHNDLPLLRVVDNPIAVDPDETLRREAIRSDWKIISLRD